MKPNPFTMGKILSAALVLALTFGTLGIYPTAAAPNNLALATAIAAALANNPGLITGASYVHQANDATTAVYSSPETFFPAELMATSSPSVPAMPPKSGTPITILLYRIPIIITGRSM